MKGPSRQGKKLRDEKKKGNRNDGIERELIRSTEGMRSVLPQIIFASSALLYFLCLFFRFVLLACWWICGCCSSSCFVSDSFGLLCLK
mmetsp:Transcript_15580/g.22918  ORF Transcript_15580/g.22918 Transcript_15580/m.22918 type:complete len:88 (-) Transcript_15580:1009-1272(-)